VVDVAFLVYIALIVAGWLTLRAPNPMGLGYLSKGIELVLVCAVLYHLWTLLSARPSRVSSPSSAPSA
jgi:heme A synthase